MAFLAIHRLAKTFAAIPGSGAPGVRALEDVTLEVSSGELMVVLGPSACGKTTLLRLIAGLETATAGTINLEGRTIDRLPAGRRNIAMVFQSPALYPEMSAGDNVAFGLRLRGCSRTEAAKRTSDVARTLGLESCLDRKPFELSGGERQRVALGRALVRRPALVLMDEPLSNLDARARAELKDGILTVQRELGVTMLYVTHDQTEALSIGHRLAVLERGQVRQTGAPTEIYDRPACAFVAGFVGSPPMNLVRGRVVPKGSGRWFETSEPGGAPGIAIDISGLSGLPDNGGVQDLTLGIRAEHLTVLPPGSSRPGFPATVLGFDYTGPDVVLKLRAGAHRLTARLPAAQAPSRGDRVQLGVSVANACFFDPLTGRNLCES